MSGHSHWSGIKHKKELTDAKRAKFFTKAGRLITVAARTGGPDPAGNPSLRLAIEKAREVNMPKVNIERAIERAAGKGAGDAMEEVQYEAFGPGGVAMIIKGVTDNKNRAIGDIKKIVTRHGGRMAEAGSISWMFEAKSKMQILPPEEGPKYGSKETEKPKLSDEELELALIEAGVDDIERIRNQESRLGSDGAEDGQAGIMKTVVYCSPNKTSEVQENLKKNNIETSQPELEMIPKQTIEIDNETREKVERLIEDLEECDDVAEIFCNFKV